ncbi:MAG: hypothetical protein L3J46_11120 [Kangiellaceae bacterium]|nr:hypothetical protein [Kangiellaceae bacterium]
MNIMIKLFLLMYLLAMVLLTIISVIWILTAIFNPKSTTKKTVLMDIQRK